MYNAECGVLEELMLGHGFGRVEVEETLDHAKEAAPDGEEPWDILEEENIAGRAMVGLLQYFDEVESA